MEKDKKEMIDVGKEKYTFDMLLNDILSDLTEDNEKDKTGDKVRREYKSKLIVIQMLINLAESYKIENYKDDEKLNNAIDIKVNGDEILSGYIFFISQNSQFDYSWNYMRKRRTNYKEFLTNSICFLNNVLIDINILADKPRVGNDVHVTFHDILDVTFINEKPFVKACLLWENFYRWVTVKSEYNICVKVNECILKIDNRKEPSDTESLIDAALEKINNMLEQKNETV